MVNILSQRNTLNLLALCRSRELVFRLAFDLG